MSVKIPTICIQKDKPEGTNESELRRCDSQGVVETPHNVNIQLKKQRSKSSDNLLPIKTKGSNDMVCWLSPLDGGKLQRSASKQFSEYSNSDMISLRSASHMTLYGSLDRFLSSNDLRLAKDFEWNSRDGYLDQMTRYNSVPEKEMRELHNSAKSTVSRSYSSMCLNGHIVTPTINYDKLEEKLSLEDDDIETEHIFTGQRSNDKNYSLYLQNCLIDNSLKTTNDETFKNYRIQSWLNSLATLKNQTK